MTEIRQAFGQHLVMDGYGCPRILLMDLDRVYEFLETCPDLIHMTKLMPPYAFKYHGKVPDDWGLSGFVLIAESHISIHTFPERNYLSLDIFSCKQFDDAKAMAYVSKIFGIGHHQSSCFDRGLEFPFDVGVVAGHVRAERNGIATGQKERQL